MRRKGKYDEYLYWHNFKTKTERTKNKEHE